MASILAFEFIPPGLFSSLEIMTASYLEAQCVEEVGLDFASNDSMGCHGSTGSNWRDADARKRACSAHPETFYRSRDPRKQSIGC